MGRFGWRLAVAVLLVSLPIRPAAAQGRALVTIGSSADDRLRLSQLLGQDSTAGFLLRTPSTMTPRLGGRRGGPQLALLYPELRSVWNSAIPYSLNDGAMWAGRGANIIVQAGVQAGYGPVEVIFDPEFTYSQNLPFQIFPGTQPGRSAFSSPWHVGGESADLPLRFGDQSVRLADLGQSSVTVYAGPVAFGASTENQWWGPGIRNAIVMSNNAQGIPHLFLRTTRPIRTPLGALEARWIIGGLTESLYFDTTGSNGLRSLSGLVVTLRPGDSRNLTLGVARSVYGEARNAGQVLGRFLDVFTRYEAMVDPGAADSGARHTDQLLSLFGRWIFPRSGFEMYAEWARIALPRSLREFLLAPQNTQGYTLGLQWARPAGGEGAVFRLQAELTDLEQSIVLQDEPPPPDFYVGRATAEGYTQRGKVIGAAIGPGASSEWLAGDYVAPRWQAGLFVGRIRWEDNALYRQLNANYDRHDVSILGGVRGGVRLRGLDVSAEFTGAGRLSYLFQFGAGNPGGYRTVNLANYTLGLVLSPR